MNSLSFTVCCTEDDGYACERKPFVRPFTDHLLEAHFCVLIEHRARSLCLENEQIFFPRVIPSVRAMTHTCSEHVHRIHYA